MNFVRQSNASFLLVPNDRVMRRDSTLYEQAMAKMGRLWGVNGPLRFNPCANPVSLERCHLRDLEERDYVVAEKSDGVRYALALLELDAGAGNAVLIALMVDRNLDAFEVRVNAPADDFAAGCIFDGELVWDETNTALGRRHAFYVFDVVAHEGACVRDRSFAERYRIVRRKFANVDSLPHADGLASERITTPGSAHRLTFCCKRFYSMHQFDIAANRPVHHASDGYVFVPLHDAMPLNRADRWYKWKRTHNIDVLVQASWNAAESRWRVCMFYLDGDVLRDASRFETSRLRHPGDGAAVCIRLADGNSALGVPIDGAETIRHVWELACDRIERDAGDGWIVECRLHAVRWDKSAPNNAVTIERSLASASDAVSLDELRAAGVEAGRKPIK